MLGLFAHPLGSGLGSYFDPSTKRVTLRRDANDYDLAHERAHEAQQTARTLLWRIHERTEAWPYVCRLARLGIEIEAAAHALLVLHRLNRLAPRHLGTALVGLLTYLFSLVDPRNGPKQ